MIKIDIVELMIKEIGEKYPEKLEREKFYLEMHKRLCNDVLYSDPKYKENTIILTNIFRNLMMDLCKEVTNYLNEEGIYSHE